jgi:outer membrane protein OmpA-like peptidoglycan-associated protein
MLRKPAVAHHRGRASVFVAGIGLALMASPGVANATDFSVKLEPGVAIPLSAPQSRVYDAGGAESLKVLFGLTPYLDIGPTTSFLLLPAKAQAAESGIAWAFGGGLRLKRPHDARSYSGVSPWLDADFFYVRTGPLNRPGFDVAVGLGIPIGESRTFWLGPFVRYFQTIQIDRTGFDNRDAKVLILGVSFEVGSGIERKREVEYLPATNEVVSRDVFFCPDSDKDGVPDSVDHCPDVVGPVENWGCPNYQKIIVHKDKLELKEKLYFAWDQATLEEASFPVLDEVAQALKDNKAFRVQVEGHADSSGSDDHNQTLSEQRAAAVLDYLAAHGVPRERLRSKGFSSSVPIDTNTTVAGRENNRRVEFVVQFSILTPENVK